MTRLMRIHWHCVLSVTVLCAGVASTAQAQVLIESTDEPGLRACFEQHMLAVPGTEREWVAQLAVASDGSVARVDSVEPDLIGEGFEACVIEALYQMQLPAQPIEGLAEIPYRFSYRVRAAHELSRSEEAPLMERLVVTMATYSDRSDACFRNRRSLLPQDTRVVPRIIIDSQGVVQDVEFTESNASVVEPCLRSVLTSVEFPRSPDGRPYAFSYPIVFTIWDPAGPPAGQRERRSHGGDPYVDFEIDYDFDFDFEVDFD